MIITVATMKGGSGKSTLASCLAVHWHLRGRRPTLIDADPQRSIVRLAARERALGGVAVIEDATENALTTARRLSSGGGLVIIDTPGFRSQTTLDCIAAADFLLVPVKPSPFDVDRMLDTLGILTDRADGRRPLFRCMLTQTTRDSVISRHIRAELAEAGVPVLNSEMSNRVAYPEASLWGATPSLISWKGPAAKEIAVIADEVDAVLGARQAAAMTRKPLPKAIRRPITNLRDFAADTAIEEEAPAASRPAAQGAPEHTLAVSSAPIANDSAPLLTEEAKAAAAKRRAAAHKIVSRYKNFAALGGLVPLPVANIASVAAVNLRMVKQLSDLYQVPFQRDRTRALIVGLIGGTVPTGVGTATSATLMFIVPGGLLWGMGASAITAGALTRAIGLVFVESFETAAANGTAS